MFAKQTDKPRISLITPSYNQGAFIEETILSVIAQNYPNLEYIIIDGGSTDSSKDIIQKYDGQIAYWISEKDAGQADAINKGLEKATGDWVGFLNSDDILKPGALDEIGRLAQNPDTHWICGAVNIFGDEGSDYGIKHPQPSQKISDWLTYHAQVPQQGSFWSRTAFEKAGLINPKMHFAFDLEYWIRLIKNGFYPEISEKTFAGFRIHDITKSMGGRSKFISEHRMILEKYRAVMSPEEIRAAEKGLAEMMADTLVYEAASLAENGQKEEARKLLKKAAKENPYIYLRRNYWGAKRRVL